jgi:hypothetical protein
MAEAKGSRPAPRKDCGGAGARAHLARARGCSTLALVLPLGLEPYRVRRLVVRCFVATGTGLVGATVCVPSQVEISVTWGSFFSFT